MKKIIILASLTSSAMFSQVGTPPTPYPAFNAATTQNIANYAWYRGGNTPGGPAGINNVFGTMWNSPIFMQTDGGNRIQINHKGAGPLQNYVGSLPNPLPGTRLTRVAISRDGNSPVTQPLSLLHLGYNSAVNGVAAGHRSWQDIGTMYVAETDNLYVGLRQKSPFDLSGRTSAVFANPTDAQDAVMSWGDNYAGNGPAPDNNLTFIFHAPLNSAFGMAGSDYGREIMRMTGVGNVGNGPRFGDNWQPTSTYHQHQEDYFSSWMQVTNQYLTQPGPVQTVPTQISATNGLRMGILGDQLKIRNGNAFIYNQEDRHLIFSTNHQNPTNITSTEERMRITSISAPTTLANNGYGIWNPGTLANTDLTRVAISHNPLAPITRPLSLLHLGYNSGSLLNPANTDGWRPWMDVGTFASQGTDNIYVGLKPEGGAFNDRQDAVIAFGDNYTNTLPGINIGPDKLRIIFTSPKTGATAAGPGAMSTVNGLEFVRYVPFHNTSLNMNDPRTGFGDFNSLLPAGTIDPGNTVEINSIMSGFNAVANTNVTGSYPLSTGASGLRFRDLTSKSLVVPSNQPAIDSTKVLTVDTLGNVVLIKNRFTSGSGLGNLCAATAQNPLTGNYEIPMAGFNFNYTMPANSPSQINIGLPVCTTNPAKLVVFDDSYDNGMAVVAQRTTAGNLVGISSLATNGGTGNSVGINGRANGTSNLNIGVNGAAQGSTGSVRNIAVNGNAANGTNLSIAGNFDVLNSSSLQNIGHQSDITSTNPGSTNSGVQVLLTTIGAINYGGYFNSSGATTNIGVYASSPSSGGTSGPNYAGYFAGDVVRTGTDNFTSDLNLKQNIDTIHNALAIIKQLKPKSFEYKVSSYPSMNLSTGKQYGLIAQDVQSILPELVNNNVHPAVLDTLGNVITPSVNFLSLEYQQLIGIMLKGIQELQSKNDSLVKKLNNKDSIQDARLAALEAAITQCCSNANARTANTPTKNQVDVELSDKDAIVLDQNVPNPFAEQTTITYNVPVSVGKAQIIFYNALGQIIQTVDIKTRGKGKVNVFSSDLSSGLYHYTLIADGKVIDSKKMVRE